VRVRSALRLGTVVVLAMAYGCATRSTVGTTPVIVDLQRGNEIVPGEIAVSLTNGTVVASGHVDHIDIPLQLQGGKTYTFNATTDDGERCGPVAVTVWKASLSTRRRAPEVALVPCAQRRPSPA
jgi:hypothetical protein